MKSHVIAATILLGLACIAGLATVRADRPGKKNLQVKTDVVQGQERAIMKQLGEPAQLPTAHKVPDFVSQFRPHPNAAGRILSIQKEVAELLSQTDLAPPQRLQHFAWLNGSGLSLIGWVGSIVRMEPTETGLRATIKVTPRLASEHSAQVLIPAYFLETYDIVNGQASLVDVAAPNITHEGTVFYY